MGGGIGGRNGRPPSLRGNGRCAAAAPHGGGNHDVGAAGHTGSYELAPMTSKD
jgi:hypothetical protein